LDRKISPIRFMMLIEERHPFRCETFSVRGHGPGWVP
jgi:hypothetical protein